MPDRILSPHLQAFTSTIFAEMTALATRTGAVNLGQGFPDTDGPVVVAEAAIAAIRAGHNQYPPGPGLPELRRAVADHQRRYYGIELDPDTDVLVTMGATEAIAAAVIALCQPGDEVIVLEPYYDSYPAAIAMAGATRRAVPLRAPDFAVDLDALAAAVTPATRLIMVNSPHNPTGRVFTPAELDGIADVCRRHDLLAITDEVYEHITFDRPHIPLSTRPGMAERTVTISSHGKTFSFTGWKIGWATGPAPLVAAVRAAKQFLTYAGGTPFQHAAAVALGLPEADISRVATDLAPRRQRLVDGLAKVGFTVFPPDGTYFVMCDAAPLMDRVGGAGGSAARNTGVVDGIGFCRALPERAGVVAVPAQVFYDHPDAGRTLIRFAYCKRMEVLDEALARLESLR